MITFKEYEMLNLYFLALDKKQITLKVWLFELLQQESSINMLVTILGRKI